MVDILQTFNYFCLSVGTCATFLIRVTYFQNVCKTKARQTTDAKKLVQQWVREGYEQLGIENPQNQASKKKIAVQGKV